MNKTKVLLAGCANPVIATDIQTHLEGLEYKVNVIGELKNLMVSVALDRPSVVCIHFHEFTHDALAISKELFEKYKIPTIFMVSSEAFKKALDLADSENILACLQLPVSSSELKGALELV